MYGEKIRMDLRRKEHLCGKQSGKWTGNDESARPGVKSSISKMAGDGGGGGGGKAHNRVHLANLRPSVQPLKLT